MDLADYIAAIRRWWGVVAVTTILTVLVAGAATYVLPKTYEAKSSVVVSVEGSNSVTDLSAVSTFLTAVLPTYASLGSSSLILDPVIQELRLDTTPDELAKKVAVKQTPETYIIDVTAENESPQGAAAIANAVSAQMIRQVPQLNKSSSSSKTRIVATQIQEATPPTKPASPQLTVNIALGLAVGLLLGCVMAMIVHSRSGLATNTQPKHV